MSSSYHFTAFSGVYKVELQIFCIFFYSNWVLALKLAKEGRSCTCLKVPMLHSTRLDVCMLGSKTINYKLNEESQSCSFTV